MGEIAMTMFTSPIIATIPRPGTMVTATMTTGIAPGTTATATATTVIGTATTTVIATITIATVTTTTATTTAEIATTAAGNATKRGATAITFSEVNPSPAPRERGSGFEKLTCSPEQSIHEQCGSWLRRCLTTS